MEVAEMPVMTSAESEPVQAVVTSLIHCQEHEEIPAPLASPEPE